MELGCKMAHRKLHGNVNVDPAMPAWLRTLCTCLLKMTIKQSCCVFNKYCNFAIDGLLFTGQVLSHKAEYVLIGSTDWTILSSAEIAEIIMIISCQHQVQCIGEGIMHVYSLYHSPLFCGKPNVYYILTLHVTLSLIDVWHIYSVDRRNTTSTTPYQFSAMSQNFSYSHQLHN